MVWQTRSTSVELATGGWIIGRKTGPQTWRRSAFAAPLGEHLGFPGFWGQ
jgi:hypothetical protein